MELLVLLAAELDIQHAFNRFEEASNCFAEQAHTKSGSLAAALARASFPTAT
jgi:hypothetical protein